MEASEGPKILVAEKGVLASRSWMVHHSADGVHVVSLDDDGWPSRGSPPLSTGYTAFTVDARGRGPMCICRNDHILKRHPNGAALLAATWPGRRHGIYMKAGCSVLGDPVVGYGCFE